jgi:hypothetical protein
MFNNRMIIVKLMGGLGNQMFQYAAARRLAIHHNTELKLDLSFLQNQKMTSHRIYGLKHLSIESSCANPLELIRYTGIYKNRPMSNLVRMLRAIGLLAPCANMCVERQFHFDPAVLGAPDNTYLDGYWQSEKYFMEIEKTIHNEFAVSSEPDDWNQRMAEDIKTSESISIHVRRGDYVSDKTTVEYHGVCSLEYYRTAIDMILLHTRSPRIFIFSDDPAWVKKNLGIHYPMTLMDHNDPYHGHEDLRLMSLCRHHIIANSSFSWWGAWLSHNPNKIVIAPKKWFKKAGINTIDLLPDGWIRIKDC